ncbi:hypothetical protein QEM27_005259 [Pseudomonas putida]|nr:hypothetical protein [Pseudomonas putida]EKT8868694.1 hypothetical protein [Pseudomonas putida]
MTESHKELIERLKRALAKMQRDLDSMPPGKGGGLVIEIRAMEQRIKREELHALSGYRATRRPVSGGAPGSNRRK